MIFKYIFLGIIQGLTEFLPISSSGHLVILQRWFKIADQELILIIMLHLGTLLATIVFFRRDIIGLRKNYLLVKYIIITTVVTGGIAVLGRHFFETIFSSTRVVFLGLLVTAGILLSTRRCLEGKRPFSEMRITDAMLIGLFQAVAIFPGISRSGATISVQLWRRMERETAFRYSFLVSIPAVLGALLMEAPELTRLPDINYLYGAAGVLSAFFTGLLSLKLLRLVIRRANLSFFGYYCLGLGVCGLILSKF